MLYVACPFECSIDTEGRLKVSGSQVTCKRDNVLEGVQYRDVGATVNKQR